MGDDCCPLCRDAEGCEGFAFIHHRCCLKANFTGTYYQFGVTSRIASSALGQGCSSFGPAQQDRDLAGRLLEDWYAPTPDLCCASCSRKTECQGFAFSNSRCYLKGDVTGTYENTGSLVHLKESAEFSSTTPAPTTGTTLPPVDTPMCPDFSAEEADTAIEGCEGFAFFHHICYLKGNFSGTYTQAGVVTRLIREVLPEPSSCPEYEPEAVDSDMSGDLITQQWAATSDDCCSVCQEFDECDGFAFFNSRCYLKGDVAGTYDNAGRITRVKRGVLPPPTSTPQCPSFVAQATDTDMSGDLIRQSWAASIDGCCTLCQEVEACEGFAYFDRNCYLKTNFSGVYYHLGAVTSITTRAARPDDFEPAQLNHDLVGELLEDWFAPLPELCMASCARIPDCEGFALHDNRCYLKANVEGTYDNPGRITGVKRGVLPLPGGRRLSDSSVMV